MTSAMTPPRTWQDWGGSGPPLHIAHANGFPPGTYRRLAEGLGPFFEVFALDTLPLRGGPVPRGIRAWTGLADDLRVGLRERGLAGVVGVGHSLGGVLTVLAASADPVLFRAVVLLDPVLFTGMRALLWGWIKAVGMGYRFDLARGASRRRDHWPDRKAVRTGWAGRQVFSSWAPGVLDDYLDAGIEPAPGGGVRLAYPKAWEARLFVVTPHDEWAAVRRLEVPTLVLRGETSDTFTEAAARRFARECPAARVETVPGTSHFLPMEDPDGIARRIVEFAGGLA